MNNKISFCSTCKNRLYQLENTIFNNIEKIKEDGNSNLILTNYNSEDDLDSFIYKNFNTEIKDGILLYFKESSSKYYESSRAKNLSHFVADGDILFNLDGDNFIGGIIPHCRKIFNNDTNILVHACNAGNAKQGSYGRIAISSKYFNELGGYDEDQDGYGWDDLDLIERCIKYGLKYVNIYSKDDIIICNSLSESIKNTESKGRDYWGQTLYNKEKLRQKTLNGQLIRNVNRQKVRLIKNFNEEIFV